jgi:hypothetical protein
MSAFYESDVDEVVDDATDQAVDAAENLVLDNLDEAVEAGLDEVIDASIKVVDEHFDHLTGNEKADHVISLAADWLVSKGVELRDEYEDEIKEGLAEWVQERFDALRAEIQEWRDTRPERRAERQKFRASQEGKSRDEKKAARKERRQAKRAARRES